MAKRIRVSDDGGTNWYTLPGNSGELTNEADALDDTIFGQSFKSSQTGLIGWTVNANSVFKGFAGYVTKILKPGVSTVMTDEAMSLVSGKTYMITASTKRIINRAVVPTVKGNGIAISAVNIESFDYLFGTVTFISSYTPTAPITITGEYYPTVAIGCANEFTLTQTAEANDTSCMSVAQTNGGVRTFEAGLKTVSLDLSGIYNASNGFLTALQARSELVIEINLEGTGLTVARGFFKPMTQSQSGDVGALEEESITFELSVPDDDKLLYPFHWNIDPSSTLNTAIEICLDAWENDTVLDVAYLPDGASGIQGNAIVTDLSLSGGLEAMNVFTVNFQGSDAQSAYP